MLWVLWLQLGWAIDFDDAKNEAILLFQPVQPLQKPSPDLEVELLAFVA
jgi:hypothetical protein